MVNTTKNIAAMSTVKPTMLAIGVEIDSVYIGKDIELIPFVEQIPAGNVWDAPSYGRMRYGRPRMEQEVDTGPRAMRENRLCVTYIAISATATLSDLNTLAAILNYNHYITPTHNVVVYRYSKQEGLVAIEKA